MEFILTAKSMGWSLKLQSGHECVKRAGINAENPGTKVGGVRE
ncbi:MAG TPA: hypothetical protein VKM35_06505 [Arenimonas sp.]|nr:hypothetical protein [Arenimonas sp.]HMB56844.1 hypothetical protein [Arenimonas sp.]